MSTGFTSERTTEDNRATVTSVEDEDLMYLADLALAVGGISNWLRSPTASDQEEPHNSEDKTHITTSAPPGYPSPSPSPVFDNRQPLWSDDDEEDTHKHHPFHRLLPLKKCQLSRLPTKPVVSVRPVWSDNEEDDNLNPFLSEPIGNEFFPLSTNPFVKRPKPVREVADNEEDEHIRLELKPIEADSFDTSLATSSAPLSNHIVQPNIQGIYLPQDTPVFVNPFTSTSSQAAPPVFFGCLPSWEEDDYTLQRAHLTEGQRRTAAIKAAENVSPLDVVPPVEAGKGKAPVCTRRNDRVVEDSQCG
ncbi:hypothetical protein MPER_11011 [Moniliophthora perniciosa FA553]|nr:hypothetical protein MPER_11011 [Moniliophthora perniciosa FA553]